MFAKQSGKWISREYRNYMNYFEYSTLWLCREPVLLRICMNVFDEFIGDGAADRL